MRYIYIYIISLDKLSVKLASILNNSCQIITPIIKFFNNETTPLTVYLEQKESSIKFIFRMELVSVLYYQ